MRLAINKLFLGLLFLSMIVPLTARGATITYQYDSLDRLVAVRYSDGTRIAYVYDAAGNRLSMTISSCADTALRGDLNNDCDTTLYDVVLALQVLAGLQTPSLRPAYSTSGADPNGNATIELADVLYILQRISVLRP